LACGIAIIGYIFAHSPERPSVTASDDAARWIDRTRADITEAALRSQAAQELVRRSLTSMDKAPSTRDR
jgi:hypothetical protein